MTSGCYGNAHRRQQHTSLHNLIQYVSWSRSLCPTLTLNVSNKFKTAPSCIDPSRPPYWRIILNLQVSYAWRKDLWKLKLRLLKFHCCRWLSITNPISQLDSDKRKKKHTNNDNCFSCDIQRCTNMSTWTRGLNSCLFQAVLYIIKAVNPQITSNG